MAPPRALNENNQPEPGAACSHTVQLTIFSFASLLCQQHPGEQKL